MTKHRVGARPMVSSKVAVVAMLDFDGLMDASPTEGPVIRRVISTARGIITGRHVYGFFQP